MNLLQTTLGLRAPTITLFTGLEQEPGFRELVRRVGPAAASRQRFGHGLDVRVRASRTVCTHILSVSPIDESTVYE